MRRFTLIALPAMRGAYRSGLFDKNVGKLPPGLTLMAISQIGETANQARGLHVLNNFRGSPEDAAHAPKIARRCVPIRGDEHAASIYRQGSIA